MTWTTLHLEVTTPLFNAGADPLDPDGGQPGVRVPSLRGAMRFWFRAFVGGVTGPNLKLLADLEHAVFGSTDRSCPVPLRIPDPPAQRTAGKERMDKWLVYLLGQGLGDMRTSTTIRPYVPPGETFDLKLRLQPQRRPRASASAEQSPTPEVLAALTVASLWLTCTYGGIGARTRRGFGGLRIVGADGWLPEPWTPESIVTPGLDYYEGLRFLWPDPTLGRCLTMLLRTTAADERKAWTGPPTFPVLHRQYTLAGTSGGGVFDDWEQTLRHAGEQLRNFRASRDAPGKPPRKTPEWKDVIWGPGDHFPLGALGLPVVFKKNGPEVNAEKHGESQRGESQRGESLRRASPLWLRAVGSGDEWRLFSFAFLGEFLPGPDEPVVTLRKPRKPAQRLRVDTDDVRRLAEQWISEMARDGSFIDTRRR